MKLAIVGSRYFDDYNLFKLTVDNYIAQNGTPVSIISGGAKGADTLAERYAHENNIPLTLFVPDWDTYGLSAGPRRNTLIVEECTDCIAFCSTDSKGTKDTITKVRSKGKKLLVIDI